MRLLALLMFSMLAHADDYQSLIQRVYLENQENTNEMIWQQRMDYLNRIQVEAKLKDKRLHPENCLLVKCDEKKDKDYE